MKRIITIAVISCFIACKQKTKVQDESQQDTENVVQQDSKKSLIQKPNLKKHSQNQ